MSIASLTRRVKNEVTCHGLWKKTSTTKSRGRVSNYIMSYLDETSKADALAEARKVDYASMQQGKMVPQEAGIDYLSKEEKGKIRAYGFLRDDVTKIGGNYAHLQDNDARVVACHRAWMSRLDDYPKAKKFAHKYVLSLDPRFCELMGATGKDTDALLVQGVRTVMRRFQEKFYPGDRLGYLVGIHHDRKHVHAHMMLFPYTERGQHLNISDQSGRKGLTEQRKVANKFVKDYFFVEFDNPIKASERPVDRVMQTRMVSYMAWMAFPKGKVPETEKYQWVAGEKKRLLALPEADLRDLLTKRMEAYAVAYDDMATKLFGKPADAKAVLQNIGRQQVEFKLKVQESEGAIKLIRELQQTNRVEYNKAQKAMSNFRFFAAQSGGTSVSEFEASTPEQRKWLTNLLADPNYAGPARASLTREPIHEIISGMQQRGLMTPEALFGDEKSASRNARGLLRATFNIRLDELKAEREKLRTALTRAYTQREGILTALDTVKVTESLASAAGKGRKPLFLEQFAGQKRAGIEMPILCRTMGPEELVANRVTEQASNSFEDLNRKIMGTLRAFQGSRTEQDVFEVDHYFRTITDALSPAKKKVQQEEAEREVKAALETQSVQDFLLAQNIRHSGNAGVSPETVRKHIKNAPQEFDL